MDVQNIIASGLLELYASGLANAQEKIQVENWIKQYPEVAAEYNAIQQSLENYAQANAIAPSANAKEKLFTTINNTPIKNNLNKENKIDESAKIIPLKNYWRWAAAASIALLIGSAALNLMYYNKYNTANNNLQQSQEELAAIKQHSNEMKHDMDIVHNPYSMPVSLKGMEVMPDATAKIFWMQDTKEVMIDASNLPDAPAGMQYQFWGIVDGKPVDGGMIITNDKGIKYRMQKMKSFGQAQAFAISLEKAGGNPIPTKVVSMGKII